MHKVVSRSGLTYAEFIGEATAELVTGVRTVFKAYQKREGLEIATDVLSRSLSHLVSDMVWAAVSDRPLPHLDETSQLEHNLKSYHALKEQLQDAVSEGFAAAMTQYSGKEVNFYCVLKHTPDAPSTSEH